MLNTAQRKMVIRDHIEARAKGRLDARYDFGFVPKSNPCKTGCWRWDDATKQNVIVLNEALDEHCIDRTPTSPGRATPYGGNFAVKVKRHEDAHSLFTDPDFTKIKAAMAPLGIPWVLLNFFEDARIEFKYRQSFKSRFGWMVHELDLLEKLATGKSGMPSLESPDFRPESIFHGIYHVEGDGKRLKALKDACAAAAGVGTFMHDKNAAYFFQFIYRMVTLAQRASTTMELIPLMKRWIDHFGIPAGSSIVGVGSASDGARDAEGLGAGGHHGSDFSEAVATAEAAGLGTIDGSGAGEGSGKKAIGSSPSHGRGHGASSSGVDHDEHVRGEATTAADEVFDPLTPAELAGLSGTDLLGLSSRMSPREIKRAIALAPLLRRALTGGISDKVKKMSPTKRFSATAWARKSDRVFRGKGERHDGRRKLVVMYDCSGSMSGHYHSNGRVLLMALSRLARSKDIEGSVIFCYGANRRLPLPLSDELVTKLDTPGGSEGFARAMKDHQKEITEAHLYIAYTDANLTDAPIDRRFWREHNLPCVALYCGDTCYLPVLQKYFEKAIIRNKIEDVAVELVKYVRYTRA